MILNPVKNGKLSLDGLRDMYTPAFADWLDDRYILFVEQFASGTTVMGGDLCVCDTETDALLRLTNTATDGFQIRSFEVFGSVASYLTVCRHRMGSSKIRPIPCL